MGDFSIIIAGIPPALNNVKLKLLLERRAGRELIENVERQIDDSVSLKFRNDENLQIFQDANIINIPFGNELHPLTVLHVARRGSGTNFSERSTSRSNEFGDDDPWRKKIYVTNIPQYLYPYRAFRYHFERFGAIDKCYMNNNKSFAYVTFVNHLDAVAARHGAVPTGPNHNLTIRWDNRDGPPARRPPPLMTVPTTRPSTGRGRGGPRRATSIGDLRQVGRRQTSPRRQQTVPQNLNQPGQDLPLYSEVLYWSNFKELPAEGGTMCVLAQNIDASTHIPTVKMHFESKKRSNGGLVRKFVKMIDGLLIFFQDAKDCESCLDMKDQTFAGKNLTIFGKKIPTYFERKFVVEGVGSSTSADTLTMFLESCSANETSPTACKKQARPGVYLIEYGEDFIIEEADGVLKNIQKQPLENKPLKASKLLRTDCLKVTGVQDDVTSDNVRLKFGNKKRTDGGPVTRVDRLKNKAILVYFADFTDAERVYERFKKPSRESIIIGQYPVEVELYFHLLANDHKNTIKELQTANPNDIASSSDSGEEDDAAAEPKRPLRSYDLQRGCDEKILFFLKKNQTHSKKLEDAFKELASIEIVTEKNSKPAVKFIPKNQKTDGKTQKTFNEECKKKFDVFVSDYTTVSPTFDKSKLQKARAAKLSPLHDKTYEGDGENIAVSWKADSVEVTGLKDAVNSLVDELKMSLELTEKKMPTNVEQYRLMLSCGIVDELRQNHTSVNIKCDDRTQSVILTGPSDDVNTVQINALTILNTIEKKRLSGIDGIILRYLAEVMKDSLDVQMQIQDKFKTDGVKAALSTDSDDVYVRVRTDADYKKACDSIDQLIAIKNIPLDDAASAIINTPLWKGFQQSIKEMGPFRVYTKQREAIRTVGIRSDLQPLATKITDFLDENATRRFCLRMSYGSARFIIEKSKEFSQDACRNEDIRCGLTSDDGGGVYVEGKKKSLDKARPRMVQLTQTIAEIQHTLTEPGIKQYYEGEEGKDFLKMTERANNCIILPMKRTCQEWEREARSGRQMLERGPAAVQTPREQLYISVKLPKSRVTLQVWKTNIIEHKCDVIINASNPQLQLLPGGVSGVIGKLDSKSGGAIQGAMRRSIRENHGDYISGEAVITTAGNLKNCKKIVHAVGPKWTSSSERDPANSLKSCIFKSLEETSGARLTSIAIPAISCGVFGGKVHVCVPLIVETVVDYFKEDTNSSIKRVDFVEISQGDVLAEFKKCAQKHRDPNSESENQQSPPTPNPRPQPATYSASSTAPTVKLLIADIASIQADVLVNITTTQGFPSMSGSAVSKALLKKAGAAIQQECAQTAAPHNLGSVFRTNGGGLSCQEICHGIVSHYNKNSKQIVTSIVATCLKTMDSAGYSSIAFPAIATGGFRHPAAKVAKWMRKEISNFSAVNLKTVIIVLYPQDTLTISIFQSEFNGAPRPSKSGAGANFGSFQASGQTAGNFGVVKVNVYQGDITQEKSDAIVNSTNSNFDLSQGQVSNAIVAQGGPQIQTDVQNGTGTDFRMTSGGNLSCQSIFHIVTPTNEKDIAKKVQMVLDNADQQGIRSISFPALATGNIGLTSVSVALTMRRAFENFGKSGVTTLKIINVVVFDRSMLSDFQTGILSPEKSLLGKFKESFNSFFGGNSVSNKSLGDEKFHLFFYSTEVESINRAYEAITRETKKMVHSQVMQDDAFGRFSEWEWWELNEAATANKVKISDKSNRYLKQLVVDGLMRDVMKANEAVKDILKDFCEAETTTTYVTWQKLVHGAWEDYEPRSANVLEKAFKTRNGNNTDPKLNQITVPEYRSRRVHTTIVDLSNLEGDVSGKNPPNVRRKVKEKVETDVLPSNWDPIPGQQPYSKVALQQNSQEYKTVYQTYTQTGGTGTMIKIERIQNVSLYKQFVAKKAEVTKKMQSNGNPVTRQLFHGTADDDKIMLNGFDRSYAGKNATAFGRGVYFATNASYSNGYALPNQQGQKRMFLADVVTGDFTAGNSGLVAPPPRQGAIKNDLYDSVVNNVAAPSIFVIFKDASAYPTYLMTYQ